MPMTDPVTVRGLGLLASAAMPKSTSLTPAGSSGWAEKPFSIMTLGGLTSRWTSPASWMYARAAARWRSTQVRCSPVNASDAIRTESGLPSMNSRAMPITSCRRSSKRAWQRGSEGWLRRASDRASRRKRSIDAAGPALSGTSLSATAASGLSGSSARHTLPCPPSPAGATRR